MNDQQPQQPAPGWQPTQHGHGQTPPNAFYPQAPPPKRSWFRRHKIMTGLLAIVAVAAVGSAVGGGGDAPAEADDAPPAAQEQTTTESEAQDAPASEETEEALAPAETEDLPGIGDEVRDGDFTFVVTEVETGLDHIGDGFTREEAQGQFVVVHLQVSNHADSAGMFSDSDQKLIDDQGREHGTSTEAMWLDESLLFEDINPGNGVEGIIAFDIPADSSAVSLELHDSVFSDGVTVSID